jgi:hypothetical protein
MSEEQLRKELIAAFKNRAMIYHKILLELRQEVGKEKAAEILKKAIQARGVENSKQYKKFGPKDLKGLGDAFLGNSPGGGKLFNPELIRCEGGVLDINFHSCPLKEAWVEAGLPEEDVAHLCEIAAAVDIGTFEGAGFKFEPDTWKPGREGCCHLHIRPG